MKLLCWFRSFAFSRPISQQMKMLPRKLHYIRYQTAPLQRKIRNLTFSSLAKQRQCGVQLLIDHLVPFALVRYHLLKGTVLIFCFRRRWFLIVHGGFGTASLIGSTSTEDQKSSGTSDTCSSR
jgi:hypothetical protein